MASCSFAPLPWLVEPAGRGDEDVLRCWARCPLGTLCLVHISRCLRTCVRVAMTTRSTVVWHLREETPFVALPLIKLLELHCQQTWLMYSLL